MPNSAPGGSEPVTLHAADSSGRQAARIANQPKFYIKIRRLTPGYNYESHLRQRT
jgi:hypothetical protein